MLDELDELQVCVGYRIGDEMVRDLPAAIDRLASAEPVYRTFPGWKQDTRGVLDRADLPQATLDYIDFLEQELDGSLGRRSAAAGRADRSHRPEPPAAVATDSGRGTRGGSSGCRNHPHGPGLACPGLPARHRRRAAAPGAGGAAVRRARERERAEPFRQALAQELITSLARDASQNLAVVAQDAGPDVEADAAVPGVHADFALDGRVQREQGRLRVWARLLLAKDGTVLWTDAYDGAEDQILVFQTEVSARIGDAVLGRLAQLVEESPAPQQPS